MRNVKILDCSLRDGGRIINCAFKDEQIHGIVDGLVKSGVDIIELGFLRGNIEYSHNSTFFTDLDQMAKFIPENRGNSMFVAFGDYGKEYGMWDFSKLPAHNGHSVDGFRIGFRKKDMYDAVPLCRFIKSKGYKLFMQGVESLNYSEEEMQKLLELVNEVRPDSFGIVDTYGAMYPDDVKRLYEQVDGTLAPEIAIDFHSHNNLQMSFAFAQQVVGYANGKRGIVLDATLDGMGKGTGNLNTELIIDFLIRKHDYPYNIDAVFDTIDRYLFNIMQEHSWTYQIPYYMAGVLSSHANNIIYLQKKHRIDTKDIKNILLMLPPDIRKRYDYDLLDQIYAQYSGRKVDDTQAKNYLQQKVASQKVLMLVPGSSLKKKHNDIERFIKDNDPMIFSVNFIPDFESDKKFAFFGNKQKYEIKYRRDSINIIVSSNITPYDKNDMVINYNDLIEFGGKYFDNSSVMLLRLLKNINATDIYIAGFDGFDTNTENYYDDATGESDKRFAENFSMLNEAVEKMLTTYAVGLPTCTKVKFITPSRFAHIFEKAR